MHVGIASEVATDSLEKHTDFGGSVRFRVLSPRYTRVRPEIVSIYSLGCNIPDRIPEGRERRISREAGRCVRRKTISFLASHFERQRR